MSFLDNLKKKSLDRKIFVAGSALAFIGFLLPIVSVTEEIDKFEQQKEVVEVEVEVPVEKLIETEVVAADGTVEKVVEKRTEIEKKTEQKETGKMISVKVGTETVKSSKNIFAAAKFFNVADRGGAGYAYNATFLVVLWLMTIAGIAAFFCSNGIILDILVWLVGAGFGIAATITIPSYLEMNIFQYSAVGSYVIFVGWTTALVGAVRSAVHVQQQGIRKSI